MLVITPVLFSAVPFKNVSNEKGRLAFLSSVHSRKTQAVNNWLDDEFHLAASGSWCCACLFTGLKGHRAIVNVSSNRLCFSYSDKSKTIFNSKRILLCNNLWLCRFYPKNQTPIAHIKNQDQDGYLYGFGQSKSPKALSNTMCDWPIAATTIHIACRVVDRDVLDGVGSSVCWDATKMFNTYGYTARLWLLIKKINA